MVNNTSRSVSLSIDDMTLGQTKKICVFPVTDRP